MFKQHVLQIPTFGSQTAVADHLNKFLAKNPSWHIKAIYGVEVSKIGGTDHHALVVMEANSLSINWEPEAV